ncbi:MAG: DNA/RNA non-specific endonuclease [Lactococcus sp.]|nr:DNA/RNA non-specific endonuclease [Lactococcus sp.]
MLKTLKREVITPKPAHRKWQLLGMMSIILVSFALSSEHAGAKTKSKPSKPATVVQIVAKEEILPKLITYTTEKSPGPTENYYWDNGPAQLSDFETLKTGESKFSSDDKGRSSSARAILTYDQYKASKGARQGKPLDPPNWPATNPKVAITFSLTGKTYHGYQFNRSHSIADSLLGKAAYTSNYNFTTGTRTQNVGANQDGGMRYAEALVEKYWRSHKKTKATVSYQTTPIYQESETVPRGSVVDIKSSDGKLNTEIVVINSAEGLSIDYQATSPVAAATSSEAPSQANAQPDPTPQPTPAPDPTPAPEQVAPAAVPDTAYTVNGQWSLAAPGMVFISNANKYYSQVTNPANYRYAPQSEADASGATRAARGNQYARP